MYTHDLYPLYNRFRSEGVYVPLCKTKCILVCYSFTCWQFIIFYYSIINWFIYLFVFHQFTVRTDRGLFRSCYLPSVAKTKLENQIIIVLILHVKPNNCTIFLMNISRLDGTCIYWIRYGNLFVLELTRYSILETHDKQSKPSTTEVRKTPRKRWEQS